MKRKPEKRCALCWAMGLQHLSISFLPLQLNWYRLIFFSLTSYTPIRDKQQPSEKAPHKCIPEVQTYTSIVTESHFTLFLITAAAEKRKANRKMSSSDKRGETRTCFHRNWLNHFGMARRSREKENNKNGYYLLVLCVSMLYSYRSYRLLWKIYYGTK